MNYKCPICGRKLKLAGFENDAYGCNHCDTFFNRWKIEAMAKGIGLNEPL
jgi:hypothetical protein